VRTQLVPSGVRPPPVTMACTCGWPGARKQHVEQFLARAMDQCAKLRGQGEDDMKVVHRQESRESAFNPTRLRQRLALRAMPIAARVVGRTLVAARAAHIEVPAQGRGSTLLDGAQRCALLRAQRVPLQECLTVRAHDVRQLKRGACARRRTRCVHRPSAERVEWTCDRLHARCADV
jgi:hypothetical protein